MLRTFLFHALCVGLTMFLIGTLFHFCVPIVAPTIPPLFDNPGLFRPWGGWTSKYMLAHPFGFALLFTAGYQALRARGGIRSGFREGAVYGLAVFVIGSFPIFVLSWASMQIPLPVILSWILQNACQYIAGGIVLALVQGSGVRSQNHQPANP